MAKRNTQQVSVTERALLARLTRALAKDGEILRKCRADSRWYHDLGDYFIVDVTMNTIIQKNVDLTELGREKGLLKQYEQVA